LKALKSLGREQHSRRTVPQSATLQIHSAIIAQSDVTPQGYDFTATDDLGGQIIVTGSNNIIRSQNLFPLITISSDDPLLGPLANNGGPTLTHALLADSPAIGHGANLLNLVDDQRGDTYARVVGGAVDIGAFELQTIATPQLPGDYSSNQVVDAADYVIWRKTNGADVPQYSGADGNGSSKIDDGDYDVWRAHFGAPASASEIVAATQWNSMSAEEQPVAQSTHSQDLALFEALAEFARPRSAKPDSHDDDLLLKEQVSRPINQHDRDEALLAITAIQSQPPTSTTAKISSNDDCAPDAGELNGLDILPPLASFSSTLN
jgi:hypothetical protein